MSQVMMIPQYNTKVFHDIYTSSTAFMADYGELGLPKTISDDNYSILYFLLMGRYGNSPIANLDETQFKIKLQSVVWQFGPAWEKRLSMQDSIRQLTLTDIQKGIIIDRESENELNVTGSNSGTVNTTNTGTDTITGTTVANHASNPGEITSESTIDHPELKYVDSQNTNKDNKTGTTNETGTQTQSASNTRKDTNAGSGKEVHTKGVLDAYAELWSLLDNDVTNDFLVKFRPLFKQFVRPEQTYIYESED